MNNNWRRKKPLIVLFIIAGIAALIGVLMFLWNSILPDVIGVTEITYWQALGIFILSKILFGGFNGKGQKHKKYRGNHKRNYKEKFMNMTEEQRETFKSEWKSRMMGK